MAERIRNALKKAYRFLLNPHLALCVGIAWLITNGWSYIGAALGPLLGWEWLTAVSAAYLAMLWFPFTPEKILTALIAIWLLKKLYPDDQRTLQVLRDMKRKVREKYSEDVQRFRNRRKEIKEKQSPGMIASQTEKTAR